MKKFFESQRIFWICNLSQRGDGYWYHYFYNWITKREEKIFAGYNIKAINQRSTSWRTLKERIK